MPVESSQPAGVRPRRTWERTSPERGAIWEPGVKPRGTGAQRAQALKGRNSCPSLARMAQEPPPHPALERRPAP
jgi:hypothetical protein